MTWLNALVQGILVGGEFALIACGLSLTFGVMRLVNIAHGDLSVCGAYLGLAVATAFGVPIWWALPLVLPAAFVVGMVLQLSLFGPALRAGELPSVLVTFGLSVLIENLLLLGASADPRGLNGGALALASFAPAAGLTISWLRLTGLLAALATLGGLHLVLVRTRWGRTARAVADDVETARMVGIRVRWIFATVAGVAVATAALAGVFVGTSATFDPYTGTTTLVVAFEAVVIGGLGSLWGTLVGGVTLGVVQQLVSLWNIEYAVLAAHLFFLLVLAVRPQGMFGGGETRGPRRAGGTLRRGSGWRRESGGWRERGWRRRGPGRQPGAPAPVARWGRTASGTVTVAGVLVGCLVFLPYTSVAWWEQPLVTLFTLVALACLWNLLAGFAGLTSFGQQAYLGVGAYALYLLAVHGVNPYVGVALAAVAAALAALPISALVLRLSGGYFAVATLVVAASCQILVTVWPAVGGNTGVSLPGLAGYSPVVRQAVTYWVALVVMLACVTGGYALTRSRIGLAARAVGAEPVAAGGVGVRVPSIRRLAYVLAALGTGAVGAVVALQNLYIEPTSMFGVQYSVSMMFMVTIGGLGTVEGPILGALLYFALQELLSGYGAWYLVLLGGLAILAVLFVPRGIWGAVTSWRRVALLPVDHRVIPAVSER